LLTITANQGQLRGCDEDGRAFARCLPDFELRACPGATRTSIYAAFADLERSSRADATIVIYLSGHGGWAVFRGADASAAQLHWPFFVTADQRGDGSFSSILAIELSELVGRCTRRCANVTVIVDACFAPELVRFEARLKSTGRHSFDAPAWLPMVHRRRSAALRVASLVDDERIVCANAAGAEQPAYETEVGGRPGGAFTRELCRWLDLARARGLSWRELIAVVTRQLERRWGVGFQRPVASGCDRRRIFECERIGLEASAPVAVDASARVWLGAGLVHGASVGDRFVTHDGHRSVELELVEVEADRSRARWQGGAPVDGGFAFPTHRGVKLAVELQVDAGLRARLSAALAGALRVEVERSPGRATLRVSGRASELRIHLPDGQSLATTPARLSEDLDGLARASLFEAACAQASRWSEDWTVEGLAARGGERLRLDQDSELKPGDCVWVEVANHSTREVPGLHLNLVERGLDGQLRVLTGFHYPHGVQLRSGTQRRLPWYVDGPRGRRLSWPRRANSGRRSLTWTLVASPVPLDLRAIASPSTVRASFLGARATPPLRLETPVPGPAHAPRFVNGQRSVMWSVRRLDFVVVAEG